MAKSVSKAQVLWIDADPVFGGSHSQVQFPIELSKFFELPENPAIGVHVGRAIAYAGVSFALKKMDFHHNDVWRLNLPTPRQGLGEYRGKVLVFEKTNRSDTYRLWTIERNTPIFRQLRMLCKARGIIGSKRREGGGRREYGYY